MLSSPRPRRKLRDIKTGTGADPQKPRVPFKPSMLVTEDQLEKARSRSGATVTKIRELGSLSAAIELMQKDEIKNYRIVTGQGPHEGRFVLVEFILPEKTHAGKKSSTQGS